MLIEDGDDQGTQPKTDNQNGKITDDTTGGKVSNSGKDALTSEQQVLIDKHVDGFIDARLKRAKSQWENEQAEEIKKVDEAANTLKLKEEKKFQELISQHEGKISEIEPQLETALAQLAAHTEMAESILAQRYETLGEAAKTATDALPGEPDVLARLNWLTANEELFKTKEQATTPRGTPPQTAAKVVAMREKVTPAIPEVVPVSSRF